MARMFKNRFQATSYWPVVIAFAFLAVLSATGIVVAGPSWSHRIVSGVAIASYKAVKAAYHPGLAARIDSGDGDYVQGLAKAVPGLVRR
jgi:hypothetical protein